MSRRRFLAMAASAAAAAASGLALGGCAETEADAAFTLPKGRRLGNLAEFNARAQAFIDAHEQDYRINAIIQGMSLEQKVAQMFIVRPEDIGRPGAVVVSGGDYSEALALTPVGGVIFFARNLIDADQAAALLASTLEQGMANGGPPLFLCVDEEGGSVSRVGGNPGFSIANVGDMAAVGATRQPEAAAAAASSMAGYLMPLGFNTVFAPVCDIANNPASDTMRWRSFGSEPQLVADMAAAQIEAFLACGLACCAKHFPGIGGAQGDSHEAQISSQQDLAGLEDTELVPFRAAVAAGVPFVMVGHLALPAVTGDAAPASLAPAVAQGLLRDKLGFEGLIVTDSLGMGAVSAYCGERNPAPAAIAAGADIALMPPDYAAAHTAVMSAIEAGEISEARIDESLRRIIATKLEYLTS